MTKVLIKQVKENNPELATICDLASLSSRDRVWDERVTQRILLDFTEKLCEFIYKQRDNTAYLADLNSVIKHMGLTLVDHFENEKHVGLALTRRNYYDSRFSYVTLYETVKTHHEYSNDLRIKNYPVLMLLDEMNNWDLSPDNQRIICNEIKTTLAALIKNYILKHERNDFALLKIKKSLKPLGAYFSWFRQAERLLTHNSFNIYDAMYRDLISFHNTR
jgi:hypothetical protein